MSEPAKLPFDGYTLYVVFHKDEGRYMANLVTAEHRTTMSYARYLMSVHLGRMLLKTEHVDHINNIKTDDRVENFQILSQLENSRKRMIDNPKVLISLICPVCKVNFYRPKNRAYKFIHLGEDICCSRSCGSIKATLH